MKRPSVLFVALALFGFLAIAEAGVRTAIRDTDYRAELFCPYEKPTLGGYLPLTLTVENFSKRTITITVRCESDSGYMPNNKATFLQTFTVEASRTQIFDMVAPLADSSGANANMVPGVNFYFNVNLNGMLIGPGKSSSFNSYLSGNAAWSAGPNLIGASSNAYSLVNSNLNDTKSRSGDALITIDAEGISTDWRALTGFGDVFLLATDWKGLEEEQRAAVLIWVNCGGRLTILVDEDVGDLGIHGIGKTAVRTLEGHTMGLGAVRLLPQGNRVLRNVVANAQNGDYPSPLSGYSSPNVSGMMASNTRSYYGFQFALLAFVVCIGPLNLMYLCRPPNRLRLFFTTPLIALGFGVLVLGYSVLQDGIGGSGNRYGLTLFVPDLRERVDFRAQISDTGMVFGSSLGVSGETYLRRLELDEQNSVTYPSNIELVNGEYTGNWIRSRSRQAQLVAAAQPTRERLVVEVAPDGESAWAMSEINAELRDVVFVDEKARCWGIDRIGIGETRQLVRKDDCDAKLEGPWKDVLQYRDRLGAKVPIVKTRNTFVAKLVGGTANAPSEGGPIRWEDVSSIAFGKVSIGEVSRKEGVER